jgi:nucleoside-diphosphate-sugar epimerase
MTSSSPQYSRVMVTGANSFYAAAIMDELVKRGVYINAAVRREGAAIPLKARYSDAIQLFIVPDITTANAYNEAVKDCEAIFHIASPFKYKFADARTEVLDPAIRGAISALNAATLEPKVRRVVFTSSVAACIDPLHETGFHRPGYTYTEKDWNPVSYEKASQLTAFPPVYTASKALAEKAAWDFMNKETRHFDLVAVNPCHTWGNYGQHVDSPDAMNSTNSDISKLIEGKNIQLPPTIMPWMTDISEVAQAHINALYYPDANGRYIIANSPYDFQQVVDLIHEAFPDADWISNVPKGNPGQKVLDDHFILDNTRSREGLGVKYQPWEQSVIDFCKQYGEDRKHF